MMTAERLEVHAVTGAVATIGVADETALATFARRLAALLPANSFVALSGDLGAGKTTLVKHVAAAVGVDPAEVVSPTFGLIHEHVPPEVTSRADGMKRSRIVHADMYRLTSLDDLAETGWDDMVAGPCRVFVEWPERIARALPDDRIDLRIAITSPEARLLTLTGRGMVHASIVARLRTTDAV